jgi:hypothetical protein
MRRVDLGFTVDAYGKLRNGDAARTIYRAGYVENEPSPMTWDWAIDWVTIRTTIQEDDA